MSLGASLKPINGQRSSKDRYWPMTDKLAQAAPDAERLSGLVAQYRRPGAAIGKLCGAECMPRAECCLSMISLLGDQVLKLNSAPLNSK